MRLAEFLSLILACHGRGLTALAGTIGTGPLESLLTRSEFESERETDPVPDGVAALFREPPGHGISGPDPFEAIEAAAEDAAAELPEGIGDFVWTFPPYRSWVEGPYPLDASVQPGSPEARAAIPVLLSFVEGAALAWFRGLPLEETQEREGLEALYRAQWVRFSTELHRALGVPTLRRVSPAER